jgi:hypothetical protein
MSYRLLVNSGSRRFVLTKWKCICRIETWACLFISNNHAGYEVMSWRFVRWMRHFLDHSLQPSSTYRNQTLDPFSPEPNPRSISSPTQTRQAAAAPTITASLAGASLHPGRGRRSVDLAWTPRPRSHEDAAAGKSAGDRLAISSPRRPPRLQNAQPPILPPTAAPSCANPSSSKRRCRRRVRSCCTGAAFRPAAQLLVAALRLAGWPAIETEDLHHGLRIQLTRPLRGKPPIWARLVRVPHLENAIFFSSCSCYCSVQLRRRNLAARMHEGNLIECISLAHSMSDIPFHSIPLN